MKVYGPYKRKDGRQHVIIIDGEKRRTVSYPKFLMEQHLGRELDPDTETVDHIDDDFTNNEFSNLQLLTRPQNSSKKYDDRPELRAKHVVLICSYCGSEFQRTERRVRELEKKKTHNLVFCSRKCQGKIFH